MPEHIKMSRPHERGRLIAFYCLVSLLLPSALLAQRLQITPASVLRGRLVSIPISLQSAAGKEPSTMQWEVTSPLSFTPVEENPPPGPAAKAAGKTVACKLKTKTSNAQTWICLLYGGLKPIPNGVIAVLRFGVPSDAPPGPARIRIDQGLAVTRDLKRTVLDAVEAVVTIRAK
jgi:hypothetical protein